MTLPGNPEKEVNFVKVGRIDDPDIADGEAFGPAVVWTPSVQTFMKVWFANDDQAIVVGIADDSGPEAFAIFGWHANTVFQDRQRSGSGSFAMATPPGGLELLFDGSAARQIRATSGTRVGTIELN